MSDDDNLKLTPNCFNNNMGENASQSSIKFSTNTKGYVSWEVKVYEKDTEEQLMKLRSNSFKLMMDVKAKCDQLNLNLKTLTK